MVEAHFDNVTLSSDYFYFANSTRPSLIKKEAFSFFYFMYYQNRLARGSYSDSQRLLYVSTGDSEYAKNYMLAHGLGVFSTFTLVLTVDIAIWIIYFIYISLKKKKYHSS
jgi:hypothetical protein